MMDFGNWADRLIGAKHNQKTTKNSLELAIDGVHQFQSKSIFFFFLYTFDASEISKKQIIKVEIKKGKTSIHRDVKI